MYKKQSAAMKNQSLRGAINVLKVTIKYLFFIIILYAFTFQFAIMRFIPFVGYWDELFALICVPVMLISCKGKLKIHNKYILRILIALILFILIGIASNFIYEYQVWKAVIWDILLNLKFFMCIITTYFIFRRFNIDKYRNRIKNHVKLLLSIYFFLVLQNKVTHLFPVADRRFGLDAEKLFFNHPTELASVTFFLILVLMLCYSNIKKEGLYIFMGIIIIISTLRFKAIATAILFVYIYLIVITGRRLKFLYFIPFIPICLIVGGKEFYFYFFSTSTMEMARGALSFTSLKIAKNMFPFGTGFGTFASWPSGAIYSPIYNIYGIGDVFGLSRDHAELVSDVFWPMIIAQNGFIGLLLFIYIVICLFQLILQCSKTDKRLYIAGIGALLYLLISSIAESAFVNPLAIPLALIIGLTICGSQKERNIN